MTRIVVSSPDELLSALPHMLGFKPVESLIVAPVGGHQPGPIARINLPRTLDEREQVCEALTGVYARTKAADPGLRVAVISVSEDRAAAEVATQALASQLEAAGVPAPMRLWGCENQWADLVTGSTGSRTQLAASVFDAEVALAGRPVPAASREDLAAALVGDRRPLAALIPGAEAAFDASSVAVEQAWALGRLDQFHTDGLRLSDTDAARMLVAISEIRVRDALWDDMSGETAPSHAAMWADLVRRAPDDVRTPAASLLGFSQWLNGDGAGAWVALEQIPPGNPYTMADLLAVVLHSGAHPDMWAQMNAELRANDVNECYVPQSPRPPSPDLPSTAPNFRPPAR